jgi:hypothetical protein
MFLPIDPGELVPACLYLWVILAETRRGSWSFAGLKDGGAEGPPSIRAVGKRENGAHATI